MKADVDPVDESGWIACHANTEGPVVACGPNVQYKDVPALKITCRTCLLLKAALKLTGMLLHASSAILLRCIVKCVTWFRGRGG